MNQTHYLLKGTFFLTAAGVLSRIAGFFYKIFLSRTRGAEQIGLFHLCMPVYAFCMAAAAGGIQTAISRFTAEYHAKNEKAGARRILIRALSASLFFALLCCGLLWQGAGWIASVFLAEPRCATLLRILALSLPFCAAHACVSGYFMGAKRVVIPALSQLIEQSLRIFSVLSIYYLLQRRGDSMNASAMALGQIAGELASALFCICFLSRSSASAPKQAPFFSDIRRVLAVSTPLGVTRMLLCVLQAIEAALLPQQLRVFGLDASAALSVYGVLTGMAIPLLMFPTAVTGSVGTLLLPLISEARTLNQENRVTVTTQASFTGSLLLGLFFFAAFFLFGKDIGLLLFDSAAAGDYIRRLSVICPFLYVNTTIVSILHGIGKTTAASVQNTAGFLLRLASVILLVPQNGIYGYFLGLLFSQLFVTCFALISLCRGSRFRPTITDSFLKPVFLCILAAAAISLLRHYIPYLAAAGLIPLLASLLLYAAVFSALILCGYLPSIRTRF